MLLTCLSGAENLLIFWLNTCYWTCVFCMSGESESSRPVIGVTCTACDGLWKNGKRWLWYFFFPLCIKSNINLFSRLRDYKNTKWHMETSPGCSVNIPGSLHSVWALMCQHVTFCMCPRYTVFLCFICSIWQYSHMQLMSLDFKTTLMFKI